MALAVVPKKKETKQATAAFVVVFARMLCLYCIGRCVCLKNNIALTEVSVKNKMFFCTTMFIFQMYKSKFICAMLPMYVLHHFL